MTLGIDGFRNIAGQSLDRVIVKDGDVVPGTNKSVFDRFVSWITGDTSVKENRRAYEALREAVVERFGQQGEQAFSGVAGKMVRGKELDSRTVSQVLDTAQRLNGLAEPRKALLSQLPDLPKGSDALAMNVVKLGLLGEGSSRLSEFPTEIWNAKGLIPATRELDFFKVSEQILALDANRKEFLDSLPEASRDLVAKRLDQAVDIAKTSLAMKDDKWNSSYVEGLAQHIMGIRDSGIAKGFPASMQAAGDPEGGRLKDQDGRSFDRCRGSDSHIVKLDKYMSERGIDQNVITVWGKQQAGDSWSHGAKALKFLLSQQRDVPLEKYWMGQGYKLDATASKDDIASHYQGEVDHFCKRVGVSERQMLQSMQVWHAMNMEFLSKVDLPGNDRGKKELTVYRTESDVAMREPFGKNPKIGGTATMKRGPAESGSIISPVSVFGSHITTQQVPHHRVFAGYYFERSPGSGKGTFLSDGEKEILFMPEGIPSKYEGQAKAPSFESLF